MIIMSGSTEKKHEIHLRVIRECSKTEGVVITIDNPPRNDALAKDKEEASKMLYLKRI